MPSTYDKKIIISGDIIEVYSYSLPVLEGYKDVKKKTKGRQKKASEIDKEINREKVLNRAARDLRRIINTNINDKSKFVTLTFADNVCDLKTANYEFKKFRQRLEYFLDKRIKYSVVVEFQKRGAVHFHTIFFNIPYIKNSDLKKLWGNGFVKINKIDNVDNVGAYVCKYMSKDLADKRLEGNKCYFTSRNLNKPIILKEKDLVYSTVNALQGNNLVYENVFKNDFNTTHYLQYNIKRTKNK